nr:hypothetical protein Hi04_10k_c962_00038 [uncultured bacterium]
MNRALLALVIFASLLVKAQPAPRDIDLTAADGTQLKASFYPAKTGAKLAPAVMLLHMCNTDRHSWSWVAEQLSAAGISALTIDNRGFGESGGPRAEEAPEIQRQVAAKWPGDFDTAFRWLLSQSRVDKNRIGAGGGSCGVNNAVKLASRHPEIRALVLLAGSTDQAGINYLRQNAWIPLFTAAATDDEYDSQALPLMQWFTELTENPHNKFVGFESGHHGTEIFGVHPELPRQIVAFYVATLQKSPAGATAKLMPKQTAASEFWIAANQNGQGERAAQIFREARRRDPKAVVCPEEMLNALAYQRLLSVGIAAGSVAPPAQISSVSASAQEIAQVKADALLLFKLNAEAHPNSANAQDSLADAYVVNGQPEEALAAEQKCLDLLPNDNSVSYEFKTQLRQTAEEKLTKLKSSSGSGH